MKAEQAAPQRELRDPTHAHAGGSRRAPRSDRRNDGWAASAMEYRLRAAGVRQRAMAHRVSSLTSVLRHARVWLSPQCSGLCSVAIGAAFGTHIFARLANLRRYAGGAQGGEFVRAHLTWLKRLVFGFAWGRDGDMSHDLIERGLIPATACRFILGCLVIRLRYPPLRPRPSLPAIGPACI
jgi:hypothetical protein